MAKTKKKPEGEGIDLIENPDAALTKAEEFFSDTRNQNIVYGIGGFIALIIAGYLAYNYYLSNRNQEAQEEMFQAVYYYEQDSLGMALNGDGNNYGFLDIIDIYSATEAANLANFYTGSVYMKLGDYESATRYLSNFSGDDKLLQARAYGLIGDAYIERDDFENAISYYQRAAEYEPNEAFTPGYMIKLAIAYEQQGSLADAVSVYDELIEKYSDSPVSQDAMRHKARVEGLMVE